MSLFKIHLQMKEGNMNVYENIIRLNGTYIFAINQKYTK